MTLKKGKSRFLLTMILAVILWAPQLCEPVYGDTNVNSGSTTIEKKGTYTFYGTTTNNEIRVNCKDPVTIILKDVSMKMNSGEERAPINIENGSNVTIKLEGKNYLRGGNHDGSGTNDGYAGIRVTTDSQVTILGEGTLEVSGGGGRRGAAGIGGNYENSCGKITIGSGTDNPKIKAVGGGSGSGNDGAAGIGGGYDGQANNGIIINSGIVEAIGGNGAAGIGGGQAYGAGSGGKAENIQIHGGTVTATGGEDAAGIGGGECGSSGDGGNVTGITITGGKITAKGGKNGPGIGAGKDAVTRNIMITGGNITATGGQWAAGIGGSNAVGEGGGGAVHGLTIKGKNVTVTATGGSGAAGIGGSDGGEVTGLNIGDGYYDGLAQGSYVKSVGGSGAAGIGSGSGKIDISNIYITLEGGKLEAIGGKDGAGIGGGSGGEAEYILIKGEGTLIAKGYDESSAIGAGRNAAGGDIRIWGGYHGPASQKTDPSKDKADYDLIIEASNGYISSDNDAAVIGGADSHGGDIEIEGAYITLSSKSECEGAGIGAGANSSLIAGSMGTIEIENCYVYDNSYAGRYAPTVGVGRDGLLSQIRIVNSYIYGAGIGGSNNQADFFDDPEITEIFIDDSWVYARANTTTPYGRVCNRAAIGSGCYGAMGLIYITGSKIDASTTGGAGIGSGGYYADDTSGELNWQGGACGVITIRESDVVASGGQGGAGIGGGWGTSVGDIIINKSKVSATGSATKAPYLDSNKNEVYLGAAGIGGGYAESCGAIDIDDSEVYAEGADNSAGIGSSGAVNDRAKKWNTGVKGSITIWSSKITAKGGAGGAGIGTGEGAKYYNSAKILINGDSYVTAYGGPGGAGIGGGKAGDDNRGGESCPITISLATPEALGMPETARIYAVGGIGAAGIGSGAARSASGKPNDAEEIILSGGYIYAKGGDEGNSEAGAGAGIGGGNGGSKLKSLVVQEGIIEAHAGYAQKRNAFDIGSGGNDDYRSDYKSKVKIEAGTVWGNISNDETNTIVDGGSVNYLIADAKNSAGTPVYKTTMKIAEPYENTGDFTDLSLPEGEWASELKVTSDKDFNEHDIYSDKDGRIYLYLPASGDNKSTAEFKEVRNGQTKTDCYYGTTQKDGTGWMKIGTNLQFKESEEQYVNVPFVLELDDAGLNGPIDFTLTQNTEGDKRIEIVEQNPIAPGAWIKLKATNDVSYTVTARGDNIGDKEMYWNEEATYSNQINKRRENIVSVEDLSKVYDGMEVEDPQVKLDSGRTDAKISYKYYDKDGDSLGDNQRPVDAGTYYVQVFVAEEKNYVAAESEKILFTITQRDPGLSVEVNADGGRADVKVYAFHAIDNPGEVTLLINGASQGLEKFNEAEQKEMGYIAEFEVTGIAGATDYEFEAVYEGQPWYYYTDNYKPAHATTHFRKDKEDRTVTMKPLVQEYYGYAVSRPLTAKVSKGKDDPGNHYKFEIVYDSYGYLGPGEETVTLYSGDECDDGTIYPTLRNAGRAIVKVTATHPAYNDAVAYTYIEVKQKPLRIATYAYRLPSDAIVTKAPYGSLRENMEYHMSIEWNIPPDEIGNGVVEMVPPPEDAEVGDYPIQVVLTGPTVIEDGVSKQLPFESRNYDLKIDEDIITVVPELLYVTADDATGKYGMMPPEYTVSFGDSDGNYGLMAWDTEDEVIASVDAKKDFEEYVPGVYKDEIIVTTIEKNYKFAEKSGASTVKNGTLTVKKGDLDAEVSVASYAYNGKAPKPTANAIPVTAEGIDAKNLAKPGQPVFIYYEKTKDGDWTQLDKAPVDAGNYRVDAVYAEDPYYNEAVATGHFEIYKAPSDVEVPVVPDIYISKDLKLSDQKLPDGWEWVHGSKKLKAGQVTEPAVYTPADPVNYEGTEAEISFHVLKNPADIQIQGDPSKVYDGTAVVNPEVVKTSDCQEIIYTYFDVDHGKNLGNEEPVKAGTYKVKAAVQETPYYEAAESKAVDFIIEKRTVALALSARENVDGNIAKAEITVEVLGAQDIELDEDAEITLHLKETSAGNEKTVTGKIKQENGKHIVTFQFARATTGSYEVEAIFAETENFYEAKAERTMKKAAGERDITVTTDPADVMEKDIVTVVYGHKDVILKAAPSAKSPEGTGSQDTYTFRVVVESQEDTIDLAENGREDQRILKFKNAGTAIVEVTVSNAAYYEDAVTYVTVNVEPRKAEVQSYAYVDERGDVTKPASVQYGKVDTLQYGLQYADQLGGKGEEVLEVLDTVPVDKAAGVNHEGWPVGIVKAGSKAAKDKVIRNYALTMKEGTVLVTPAPLTVHVNDAKGRYGHEEPVYTCIVGTENGNGLLFDDTEDDVVASVALKDGLQYESLKPGIYKDGIVAESTANRNYTMTIVPGTLTMEKADVYLYADIDSKVYDGNAVEADISVTPDVTDNVSVIESPAEPDITYKEILSGGRQKVLGGAPKDAGTYVAEVVVPANDYYSQAETKVDFVITKADYAIETPKLPDLYMKKGLILSDQKLPAGWAWIDGSKLLSVGEVREYAAYELEDPKNYNEVKREIVFHVLRNEGAISFVEDPSKVYDGQAVANPEVLCKTDATEVTYTYYDVNGNKSLGSNAPASAGKYTVTAETAQTDVYTAAKTEPMEFTIEKRDVSLAISARGNVGGNISKAEITVEVLGAQGVNLDENAQMILHVKETGGSNEKTTTEKVEKKGDKYIATFAFTRAATGAYEVEATFVETDNFHQAKVKKTMQKAAGERTLTIAADPAECMKDDCITVEYGHEDVVLKAIPSIKSPEGGPGKDSYDFRIVLQSEPDTIMLSENGKAEERILTFKNAGTAIVEVTVSNDAYYADAVAYALIKVEPRKAEVQSYAYTDEKTDVTKPAYVQYGKVDTLQYGLQYTDKFGDSGKDVCSILEIVPINPASEVNDAGWSVGIVKDGDEDAQKHVERNYALTLKEGVVFVTPAPLLVTAEDAVAQYGKEEPAYSCKTGDGNQDGLLLGDTKDEVVSSVALKGDLTYASLKPGVYEDVIVATIRDNRNYDIVAIPGTLTIEKANVILSADAESKTYDGKPVEAEVTVEPDVAVAETPEEAVITYKELLDDGSYRKLEAAPKDAGSYIAEVIVPENDFYRQAETKVEFTIAKADYHIETPKVDDMYMREGLKLSDQKLPEGWKWVDGTMLLGVGEVREYATYELEDPKNYNEVKRVIPFNVLRNEAKISFVENPSKVYDGSPVTAPQVAKVTDAAEVVYTYHDTTKDISLGSNAPVNAGVYIVTAETPQTDIYTAAQTKPMEFVIEKRDIVLAITGEDQIEGDIAKAKVTVEVLGAEGVPLDENAAVTLRVSENEGPYAVHSTESVKSAEGRYIAEFNFTRAAANHYEVEADFAETQNYNAVTAVRAFDKEPGERTVDVTTEDPQHMEGSVITATYGTGGEIITATPSVEGPYADSEGDVYDFEIVSDALGKIGEPTIALEDTGTAYQRKLIFKNAGVAVIKVTVSNEAYYADAIAYVVVVVEKADAKAISYVYMGEDQSGEAVSSVEYGKVNLLTGGLKYEGYGDGNHILDLLKVMPFEETLGVTDGGWPVEIVKTGDAHDWKSIIRNYNLTVEEGVFFVTPKPLLIQIADVTGSYGEEPEAYQYSIEGLTSWDNEDDIIVSAGLADGRSYKDLKPGVYEDLIVVTLKDNQNYATKVEKGTLTIPKIDVEIEAHIQSKDYDGKPAQVEASAMAVLPDNIEAPAEIQMDIRYYAYQEDGTSVELSGAPADPGKYFVKVTVAEDDCYNGAEYVQDFEVYKTAGPNEPDKPDGPNEPGDADESDDGDHSGEGDNSGDADHSGDSNQSGDGDKPEDTEESEAVNTGDDTAMMEWVLLFLMAVAAYVVFMHGKKAKR